MTIRHVSSFLLGVLLTAAVAGLLWWRVEGSPERLRTRLLEAPEFLADHPEILSAAQAVLQSRALASQGSERAELIRTKWQSLVHVAFTPTLGRADAPLVLLEFTDYTCEPCRASAHALSETLSANSDVRVAVLLLPTGGALAEYAARVALAAYRQNPEQFSELHALLMDPSEHVTQDSILAAVAKLGFDIEQIERETASDESRRYFSQVRMFAEDMHISGVPAFVMNEQLVLGGVTSAQLATLVQAVRRTRSATEPLLVEGAQ